MKKVTVITICKNSEDFISETMQSVYDQTYNNIDYIIKDGFSSDNTLNNIYNLKKENTKIISTPDTGISDAWNQALLSANGEYIALLNAGDYWEKDFLEKSICTLEEKKADISFSKTKLFGLTNKIITPKWNPSKLYRGIGFLHPSLISKKKVYDQIGGFDKSYKYAMDADWIIRASKEEFKFVYVDSMAYMESSGISNNNFEKAWNEYIEVLKNNKIAHTEVIKSKIYLQILKLKKKLT